MHDLCVLKELIVMKRFKFIFPLLMGWMLFSCTGLASEASAFSGDPVVNITPGEVSKKLQEEKAILIDVRTPGEVAEGFIPGTTVFADVNGSNFQQIISALDTSKTYVVYCRSGARSSSAAGKMSTMGFTHLYNMSGGIMQYTGQLAR
jgi:rhodanese-related sulfurtransferase